MISRILLSRGLFFVNVKKSTTNKLKEGVQLEFQLTQHVRDEQLMRNLNLDCGKVYKAKNVCRYRVTKLLDLTENFIPGCGAQACPHL